MSLDVNEEVASKDLPRLEPGRFSLTVHDVELISSSANAKFEEIATEISKEIAKVAKSVSTSE